MHLSTPNKDKETKNGSLNVIRKFFEHNGPIRVYVCSPLSGCKCPLFIFSDLAYTYGADVAPKNIVLCSRNRPIYQREADVATLARYYVPTKGADFNIPLKLCRLSTGLARSVIVLMNKKQFKKLYELVSELNIYGVNFRY